MPAEQRQLLPNREPHGVVMRERPASGRQQHDRLACPQILDRLEERLGLEHHPSAPAVRRVVYGLVPIARVLAQLHHPVPHESPLRRATENADPERRLEDLREQRRDINRQHHPPPRSDCATAPPPRAMSPRRTTTAIPDDTRAGAPRSTV